MRDGDELRGSSASFSRAANRSSLGSVRSFAISRRRSRFAAYRFASVRRFLFRSMALFLAMRSLSSHRQFPFLLRRPGAARTGEGKIEFGEQRPGLLVGVRRGADDHVETPDPLRLVVVDLGKHDVLPDTQRIVAGAVEASR